MSVSDLVWGAHTLAQVDAEGGLLVSDPQIGSQQRMLDGTLRTQLLAQKAAITLKWSGLTAVQKAAIVAAYAANKTTATALQVSDGRTWNVIPALTALVEEAPFWEGGVTPLYTLSLELLEA